MIKNRLTRCIGILTTLFASTSLWADHASTVYRLPAWGDSGTETVEFNSVDVTYKKGKTLKGYPSDSYLTVESSESTVLSLKSDNGLPGSGFFNGYILISATFNPKGTLSNFVPSTIAVYSNDSRFGTGNEAEYNCNNSGKNCTTGQLIYGGDLTVFGFSGIDGIFEFMYTNLSGWATDNWNVNATDVVHVKINLSPFDIFHVKSNHPLTDVGEGFAVIRNAAP